MDTNERKPGTEERSAGRGSVTALRVGIVVAAAAAVTLTLYAVVAPILASWLAQRALEQFVARAPGRTASVGSLRFNPFTLTLELTNIASSEPDRGLSYAAERVSIDFDARTLLESRPVLDALKVTAPHLELDANAKAIRPPAWARLLAGARIDRLSVQRGVLAVGPGRGGEASDWKLNDMSISADALDARAGAGRFSITVADALGAKLDAEGSVSDHGAAGHATLSHLDASRIMPRLGIATRGASGQVTLHSQFAAELSGRTPTLELTGARAEMQDIELRVQPGLTIVATQLVADAEATVPLTAPASATGEMRMSDGSFAVIDRRVDPPMDMDLVDGSVTWTTAASSPPTLVLQARAAASVGGTLSYTLERFSPSGAASRIRLRFDDIPTHSLEAYVRRALGRGVAGGSIDADVEIAGGKGRARIKARGLQLAPDATEHSTALALALLEDPDGVVALDTPIDFTPAPDRPAGLAVADTLHALLATVANAPYATLAAVVGVDPDALRAVDYEPGAAMPSATGGDMLAALAAALLRRPQVGIEVAGGFDAQADRRALAVQQIELHVALATAGPTRRARPAPVDFASPRAQDVLDEFAAQRLPAAQVASIAASFDLHAGAAADAPARVGYYRAIFAGLVAHESIPDGALDGSGVFEHKPSRMRSSRAAWRPIESRSGPAMRCSSPMSLAFPYRSCSSHWPALMRRNRAESIVRQITGLTSIVLTVVDFIHPDRG